MPRIERPVSTTASAPPTHIVERARSQLLDEPTRSCGERLLPLPDVWYTASAIGKARSRQRGSGVERTSILTSDVLHRALDRGIARAVVPVRSLGRAAGVSHNTAARWLRGEGIEPENEAKLRRALGIDEEHEPRARR